MGNFARRYEREVNLSRTVRLNLLATAIAAGSFRAFITALARAQLSHLLAEPGPFTILVPTDAAFTQLTGRGAWNLTSDLPTLKQVLACHIVPGRGTAAAMVHQHSLHTLRGERIEVQVDRGIRVGGARLLKSDLVAANGLVHIIDRVILPAHVLRLGLRVEPVVIAPAA